MRGGHNKKPIIWNGQKFESLKELQDIIGVTYQSIGKALKNGHKVKGYYVKEIKL